MLQSFIVMGAVSVIWVVFGFGLTFGDDIAGIIGNPVHFFIMNNVGRENVGDTSAAALSEIDLGVTTIPLALFALFQMKFAIITPSLITGSFAERVKFSGYLIFMMLWVILVYCPLAHMTWHPNGLFANMHVHDFAGGIVVHAASGIAALAGAIFLGKRKVEEGKASNIPFVLLGAALLWLGWFGFNGGIPQHQHRRCNSNGDLGVPRLCAWPPSISNGSSHRCCGGPGCHHPVGRMGYCGTEHLHLVHHYHHLQHGSNLQEESQRG